MNIPRVTALLQETGTSHRFLNETTIRINKLIDGASRPVLVFDCYTNRATVMPDFDKLGDKEAGRVENLEPHEVAVINAMRRGAKVKVTFHDSNELEYQESLELSGKALPHLKETDCSKGKAPNFIDYSMRDSEYGASVEISHYIHTK